ncbi:hypothetical protein BU14_1461s0002 [Porphyra umbilicalis]|uniref:DNA2/NAM7 helicase helicase domain-containing protein n=1 Tax=Porphyra umbilicalis TaxID=2786 RepID=A0A1X6NM00_PORUM|nr:hypothetical protein BU14_1461s0002 [Porphyra umbilicalis]|eukprot:OSX69496.1 hypothetical protein BU14_1461s0002 [Porphyra umbilicalis]
MTATARLLTARGQAEAFVARVSAPPPGPGERTPGYKEHAAAREAWCCAWEADTQGVLDALRALPKTREHRADLIAAHERLERLQRDMRRFAIVSEGRPGGHGGTLRAIERTFIEDAQLVFATLSGASSLLPAPRRARGGAPKGRRRRRRGGRGGGGADDAKADADEDAEGDFEAEVHVDDRDVFDLVIIDEAAQATEPASIIPLCLGASRVILVGDPQQLPATVLSGSVPLGLSLLDRLVRSGVPVSRLDTQYRMHPAISAFPCRHFYGGRLGDDPGLAVARDRPWHHAPIMAPRLGPYVFLDVRGGGSAATQTQRPCSTRSRRSWRRSFTRGCGSSTRATPCSGPAWRGATVAAAAAAAAERVGVARTTGRPTPTPALASSPRTRSSCPPCGPRLAARACRRRPWRLTRSTAFKGGKRR